MTTSTMQPGKWITACGAHVYLIGRRLGEYVPKKRPTPVSYPWIAHVVDDPQKLHVDDGVTLHYSEDGECYAHPRMRLLRYLCDGDSVSPDRETLEAIQQKSAWSLRQLENMPSMLFRSELSLQCDSHISLRALHENPSLLDHLKHRISYEFARHLSAYGRQEIVKYAREGQDNE